MKRNRSYQNKSKHKKGPSLPHTQKRRRDFNFVPPEKKTHARKASDRRRFRTVLALFHGTQGGYGFASPVNEDVEDVFIPARETLGALDGDTVLIEVRERRDPLHAGKTEGSVLRIEKERESAIIGTLVAERGYKGRERFYLVPNDKRLSAAFSVVSSSVPLLDGHTVMAEIIRRPFGERGEVQVHALRDFGEAETREACYEAILAECGVPVEFDEEVLREAELRASIPLSSEGRVRRSETVITLDGADAKDLDDAISLTAKRDGSYLLGVHIADVSAYVLRATDLDRAAFSRGTSLYFADKVVPMLPPVLSNGACSLNAGEDKYALSALLSIDQNGEITNVKLEKSIIRSSLRGVYEEANDVMENGAASPHYEKYKQFLPLLRRLRRFYLMISEKRRQNKIELERPEAKFLLDENGLPIEIVRRERGLFERVIEECMLLANEGVARFLSALSRPCVYRVHGAPHEDKASEFLRYAHNLSLESAAQIKAPYEPRDFARLMSEASDKGISEPLSYLLLRTMEKACYSQENRGHFGLDLPIYCHFTSPIRRVSDLAVHRIVSELLAEKDTPSRLFGFAAYAAETASETELRALTCERKIESLYKLLYLQKRIGKTYEATVSSVLPSGVFLETYNTCEGFIPIEDLITDTHRSASAVYDEERRCIIAGGVTYALGTRVTITVERVELSALRAYFRLAEPPRTTARA